MRSRYGTHGDCSSSESWRGFEACTSATWFASWVSPRLRMPEWSPSARVRSRVTERAGGRWEFGLTPIGRATIAALDLNRIGLVNLRRVLPSFGEHPPADSLRDG